uniref:Uncharacterized protein n=1 Tax=Hordeum vulgare subsp. vulgare TaxID=112509 RepID=A0A023INH1_HORVV|nr:hypothetical protein [Hordeum vulgare subsp. vulgare]
MASLIPCPDAPHADALPRSPLADASSLSGVHIKCMMKCRRAIGILGIFENYCGEVLMPKIES